ncbi:MAG: RluA family pseudouridine synthase [Proteobacteria bacterium]|nr:RluA family pseudouridine synthase [Pseudomonadota bacterium]
MRLDRFIRWRIPRLSRTRAQQIVRACAFRADGSRRRAAELVRGGEVVLLVRRRFAEPEVPLEFRILMSDDSIVAVDKPAGLPVHPSATYHRNTLSWLLRQRFPDGAPRIAHRLDRETSGVVLCGRHPQSERALKIAFERRLVRKRYVAIVRGVVQLDSGVIDLPVVRSAGGLHLLMQACVAGGGRPALTRYRVLARSLRHTLLQLEPQTGRQHQLRVHLSALGHPILGDKLYGPEGEGPFLEYIETGMTPSLEARLGHHRQALHAQTLRFSHPSQGDLVSVSAPLAADLGRLWRSLSPPSLPPPALESDSSSHRARESGYEGLELA